MLKRDIIRELFHVGAVKFGNFTLKSGQTSPVYIDLRTALTYPNLLRTMGTHLLAMTESLSYDFIVGVPYTAWPLATCMSMLSDTPMLLQRKEAKAYGTCNATHGNFQAGQTCLLVEDVVTTGSSIFETIEGLESVGLRITDILCFVDRQQGAKEALLQKGYRLHSVLNLQEVLNEQQNL